MLLKPFLHDVEDSFSARGRHWRTFVKHQNVVQPMYFLLNQSVVVCEYLAANLVNTF